MFTNKISTCTSFVQVEEALLGSGSMRHVVTMSTGHYYISSAGAGRTLLFSSFIAFPSLRLRRLDMILSLHQKLPQSHQSHLNTLILGISLYTRFPFLGIGLLESQNLPLFILALDSCEECFKLWQSFDPIMLILTLSIFL